MAVVDDSEGVAPHIAALKYVSGGLLQEIRLSNYLDDTLMKEKVGLTIWMTHTYVLYLIESNQTCIGNMQDATNKNLKTTKKKK